MQIEKAPDFTMLTINISSLINRVLIIYRLDIKSLTLFYNCRLYYSQRSKKAYSFVVTLKNYLEVFVCLI